jgi:hypothetical protein
MSFDEVVFLNRDEAAVIGAMLDRASAEYDTVRVAIDDGGLKLALGHQVWTPALGSMEDPRWSR